MKFCAQLRDGSKLGCMPRGTFREYHDGHTGDVIMQTVATAKIHLQVGELRDVFDGAAELALFRRERIEAEVVVHNQAEPQSQPADLDCLLLNVNAKKTIL